MANKHNNECYNVERIFFEQRLCELIEVLVNLKGMTRRNRTKELFVARSIALHLKILGFMKNEPSEYEDRKSMEYCSMERLVRIKSKIQRVHRERGIE